MPWVLSKVNRKCLRACLKLGGAGLGWLLAPGEAAAHRDDHGPVDNGLVVFGEAFVVADGATAAGDPGQGPLDDPPAGQPLRRKPEGE
jgi:hypothetical protein